MTDLKNAQCLELHSGVLLVLIVLQNNFRLNVM